MKPSTVTPPTYADVEAAATQIRGAAHRTPVFTSRTVDAKTGATVFFKGEHLQRGGAFKFRGAYNALSRLSPHERRRGVVTFSSGNHAQAIALVGQILDIPRVIVMPDDAPAMKKAATLGYGAEVVTYDRDKDDREAIGRRLAEDRGLTMIPPYDHPHVVAGAGTCARELFEETGPLDLLLVPCGGGGLLAGSAISARAMAPACRVIGVEPLAGNDGVRSFQSRTLQSVHNPQTIADGARTPSLGALTFPIILELVSDMLAVDDDAIIRSMRFLWERMKLVVEPTGMLAATALLEGIVSAPGARIGVILSGGNVDLSQLAQWMASAMKRVARPASVVLLGRRSSCRPATAQQAEPGAPRTAAPLTILQINDVYETLPVDGAGGLARVATLKKNMAAIGRTPILILAGDFLSPSVASSVFKGRQMIAALNAAGLDFATFGNHEFDFGDDVLIQRMGEATFQWLAANVIDTRTNQPIGGAAPYVIRTFGGLRVGFLGLCLTTTEISRERLTHTRLDDPIETAARYVPEMKQAGADVIVAVTHLAFGDDRRLATRFPDIDLIVGGHEHYPITSTENRTLISKAGSDAKFVARLDVNKTAAGVVERFYELIPITASLKDDPDTLAVVNDYESRLSTQLQAVVGATTVPLDAETVRLRAGETNLGNFFADVMRAEAKADIAIVNSGSIRGERIYPAGPITRREIIDIHPFGGVDCVVAVTGAVVRQALESGVSKLPASAGQFPQVSGLTMKVNAAAPVGSRVTDIVVNGQPLDPAKTYSVAITDYMLGGGDDYTMFPGQRVLVSPEAGSLIVNALEKVIEARKDISPAIDGRIAMTR